MNIMLVSVTERVREIGLRKALGATPRLIRRQFLVEASVLGLWVGRSGPCSAYLARDPPALHQRPDRDIGLGDRRCLLVAIAIGVIFGVYPASRAAHLRRSTRCAANEPAPTTPLRSSETRRNNRNAIPNDVRPHLPQSRTVHRPRGRLGARRVVCCRCGNNLGALFRRTGTVAAVSEPACRCRTPTPARRR